MLYQNFFPNAQISIKSICKLINDLWCYKETAA